MINREEFNILIVDDEEGIRRNLKMHLEMDDYTVFTADSGNSAIEIIKNNDIHFVISDVQMPNGTGVHLLDEVRNFNDKLPVILLVTGFAEISKEDAVTKGALDLLDKPINMDIIEKYLEDQVKNFV